MTRLDENGPFRFGSDAIVWNTITVKIISAEKINVPSFYVSDLPITCRIIVAAPFGSKNLQ